MMKDEDEIKARITGHINQFDSPGREVKTLCEPAPLSMALEDWQKAHPYDAIEVEPIGEGIYRIHSFYDKESIAVTAQGLRDLYDWCLLHMRQLEEEATRSSQEQPPASPSR